MKILESTRVKLVSSISQVILEPLEYFAKFSFSSPPFFLSLRLNSNHNREFFHIWWNSCFHCWGMSPEWNIPTLSTYDCKRKCQILHSIPGPRLAGSVSRVGQGHASLPSAGALGAHLLLSLVFWLSMPSFWCICGWSGVCLQVIRKARVGVCGGLFIQI